jgi:hypothetical protein
MAAIQFGYAEVLDDQRAGAKAKVSFIPTEQRLADEGPGG